MRELKRIGVLSLLMVLGAVLVVAGRRQGGVVTQPAQAHLARRLRRLALLVRVVGHEGGEPLGPVAGGVINVHAVAPPVVQHLVAERRNTCAPR